MDKELKKKYDSLVKCNTRFRRWENGLNATITKASLLTLFSKATNSPLDWTNIWLLNLISNSTYDDSTPQKTMNLFCQAIDNKIIKGFQIDGKGFIITLNDDSQIKFAKLTDFIEGIEKDLPELLTPQRHGHCHINSFSLANAIEPDCELCSGFCSAQSQKRQFPHSWVETQYKGQDFVMDCNYNMVIDKQGYYQILKPKNVVRIPNQQVKSDRDLIFQTSFAHSDVRLYCFFPDDIRREVKNELGIDSNEQSCRAIDFDEESSQPN